MWLSGVPGVRGGTISSGSAPTLASSDVAEEQTDMVLTIKGIFAFYGPNAPHNLLQIVTSIRYEGVLLDDRQPLDFRGPHDPDAAETSKALAIVPFTGLTNTFGANYLPSTTVLASFPVPLVKASGSSGQGVQGVRVVCGVGFDAPRELAATVDFNLAQMGLAHDTHDSTDTERDFLYRQTVNINLAIMGRADDTHDGTDMHGSSTATYPETQLDPAENQRKKRKTESEDNDTYLETQLDDNDTQLDDASSEN